MNSCFPESITKLPQADIPLDGITAYVSQSENHQIIFMQFAKDITLPAHAHCAQIGIVLQGRIDLVIDGRSQTYRKGDQYHIPLGVRHSGKIYAGYADVSFFNDPNRYQLKEPAV